MSDQNRQLFADALMEQFDEQRRKGKPEAVLKNIYIKMMCWLYYKFERLMPFLGEDEPPKILYECTAVSSHELMLLRMLSSMGADILLLEPKGDSGYLAKDASSAYSQLLYTAGEPFPADFTLKAFRKEMSAKAMAAQRPAQPAPNRAAVPGRPAQPAPRPAVQSAPNRVPAPARPIPTPARPAVNPARPAAPVQPRQIDPFSYFPKPSRSACTNAWMQNADYTEILTPVVSRSDDFRLFCHAFIRVRGVPDKLMYMNELYNFYQRFRNTGRKLVVVDDEL